MIWRAGTGLGLVVTATASKDESILGVRVQGREHSTAVLGGKQDAPKGKDGKKQQR